MEFNGMGWDVGMGCGGMLGYDEIGQNVGRWDGG